MRQFHRLLIAACVLTVVAPAAAQAKSGSLLSGYSGPGGGEQSVLGAQLLPAKHGDGGIRAASHPAVAPVVVVAPSPPSPPTTGSTPAPHPHPHHKATTTSAAPATRTTATTTVATVTVTPRPSVPLAARAVSYPASAAGAGLPLSGSTLLGIVLALLLLAGTAMVTRTLARPAG
jgi:hypothetical protein